MNAFSKLSRIKPFGDYRFDLDKLIIDSRRRELEGFLGVIKNAKKEFRNSGARYAYSTYKIFRDESLEANGDIFDDLFTDYIIGATMNDKVAINIIGYLDHQRYFIQMKFIIGVVDEHGEGQWIMKIKRDPILANGKNVVLSRDSKPGLLVGIDRPYYVRAYPVTAVIYGLFPLKKVKISKLKPMKISSTLNCVAERVTEHFKNSLRGQGLTQRRKDIITSWANLVSDVGATIDDVAKLEKN